MYDFDTLFELTAGELAYQLAVTDPDVYALDYADAMRHLDAISDDTTLEEQFAALDFTDSDAPSSLYLANRSL